MNYSFPRMEPADQNTRIRRTSRTARSGVADPGAPGSFLLLAAWLLLAAPAVLHIWLALRIESARFQDFPSPGLPGPQETMLPICAFLINRCGRRMPRPALAVPSPEGAEEL